MKCREGETQSGHVANLYGSAKFFPCVHLLIYPVQIIFSVSIMRSVFNDSFRMHLLPLFSKAWAENLRNHVCSFLNQLKVTLVGDCTCPELLLGFLLDFTNSSFWWRCSMTLLTSLSMAPSCLALGGEWEKFLCSLHILMAKKPSSPWRAPCSLKQFFREWNNVGFRIDDGLICSTLGYPDWPLRPMGSPPPLKGENYKSKSKRSCLVEVSGQSNICVRMD